MNEFPPELIQQLIELGVLGEQSSEIDKQIAQAQRVRSAPTPKGMMAGNIYVASSPLAHIGQAWQAFRAHKQQKELNAERAALMQRQQAARSAFARQFFQGAEPSLEREITL
jgi:hypothetical protein